MQRKDWLLLYLALPFTQAPLSIDPIRMMKGMFLFAQKSKRPKQETYDFEPYMYGPCSFEIYHDRDQLRLQGFVDTVPVLGQAWSLIQVTGAGLNKAKELAQEADKEGLMQLEEIKKRVMSLSFLELLRTVYTEFPEYARKSVVPSPT